MSNTSTDSFLERLNTAQGQAARIVDGPLLVIAGAGTGKTRTIVYRLASLVHSGVAPHSILLLTFTRRAARSMISRAAELVGEQCHQIAGGTFHSFANLMLHKFGHYIGLDSRFTVLDQEDVHEIIASIRGEMHVSERGRSFPRRETIAAMISKVVNQRQPLAKVLEADYEQFAHEEAALARIHDAYTEFKRDRQLVDFDDLLTMFIRLMSEHRHVQEMICSRCPYVMVDEYQDTNLLQAEIVFLLAGERRNVMVVGDEAQSIYGFRGASCRNLFDFRDRFDNAQIVRLEQNYRSTQPILDVSNGLLGQMEQSFRKHLYTDHDGGEKPFLVIARNETEQAEFVIREIMALRRDGIDVGDISVLFRASFHSYQLELELKRHNVPFVKYGGFRFTEASHLKDVLAHLRASSNKDDEVSLQRILQLCAGIGPAAARKIVPLITEKGVVEGLKEYVSGKKPKSDFADLRSLMGDLVNNRYAPKEAIDRVIEYYTPIMTATYDDWPKRARDLQQLVAVSENYQSIGSMLADMVLDPPNASQNDTVVFDSKQDRLTLSTVHSAKGLEWKAVFILHAINGSFPMVYHGNGMDSPEKRDEELRLLYVAVTRAKRRLYLVCPQFTAKNFAALNDYRSPFLQALPANMFQHKKVAPLYRERF